MNFLCSLFTASSKLSLNQCSLWCLYLKCSRVPPVPECHYAEAAGKTGGGSSVG